MYHAPALFRRLNKVTKSGSFAFSLEQTGYERAVAVTGKVIEVMTRQDWVSSSAQLPKPSYHGRTVALSAATSLIIQGTDNLGSIPTRLSSSTQRPTRSARDQGMIRMMCSRMLVANETLPMVVVAGSKSELGTSVWSEGIDLIASMTRSCWSILPEVSW